MANTQVTPLSHLHLAESIALACKAAADDLRLRILKVLESGSFAVLELCQIFDHKQSGLSHHLKVLYQGGLVETHREGNTIFYRRSTRYDLELGALIASLHEAASSLQLSTAEQQGIQAVFAQRSIQSEQFFTKVGSKFNEYQERIAQSSTYLDACLQLIDEAALERKQHLLEIGPGEGPLLADLASRFENVTALDTSLPMLNRAKANTSNQNVYFVHGDIDHDSLQDQSFDCIVLSMVLHHVASPPSLIKAIANKLAPNGVLVLTDLAEHEQDWVQSLCGDLWLGFKESTIDRWATESGLLNTKSMCLAQRNGFQVIAKQFTRAATAAN